MRLLSFGLIVVAACGDSQQGALLTVNAPDGPSTASRIEIVLASANPATIDDIPLQRQRPTDLSGEPVRYYRQRATAGVVPIGANGMDSFAVRLEADGSVPDDALIPFLVARDDNNTILGIGAYLENDRPAPVTIVPGQLLGYEITMTALTVTAGTNGIGDNQVLTVRCDGFDSGIAWKPGATQFRLLLPDRSNDAAAVDASGRTLDMDCDGAEALHDDCDDLRSEFHIGADEVCDGLDYDCDSRRLEVVSCPVATGCNGTPGVQLCADVNAGSTIGSCARDPSCACQVNNNCNRCAIPFTDAGQQKGLCEPYLSNPITIPVCLAA